jgi:hypothetical protein
MYVAVVPNRGSPPAILLRESFRDGAKVRNRTLANLSKWPAAKIEALRAVLRGDPLVPAAEGLEIVRALPHGHVLAALGTARRIGLDRLLPRGPARRRQLALALIVARLLEPAAKLATARALDAATASHSLGATLGLDRVSAKEVYAALDWLGQAQPAIERALARRQLADGTLVLGACPRAGRAGPGGRHLELPGGPLLRARPLRLQPRRPARQAADRGWAALRARRLPGGGRGVRRRRRRSEHAGGADRQDQAALRLVPGGPGR